MGGMVLETNLSEISKSVKGADKHCERTRDSGIARRMSLKPSAKR
jgi:hypothetical protein